MTRRAIATALALAATAATPAAASTAAGEHGSDPACREALCVQRLELQADERTWTSRPIGPAIVRVKVLRTYRTGPRTTRRRDRDVRFTDTGCRRETRERHFTATVDLCGDRIEVTRQGLTQRATGQPMVLRIYYLEVS